jgi:uncharacterized protein
MTEQPAPPEIVLVAHYNLVRVKEILAEDPSLLNIMHEPWQETPLGAASHVGNRAIAEYLLEKGAPLTIPTAAMLGRVEDVKAFLSDDPANVHTTGAHGISLLYHAAMSGSIEIVEMLKSGGASLETAGHALHGAAQYGHFEMVQWLLNHGANPNATNFQDKTPLAVAKSAGYAEVAALLEASGGKE